MASWWAKVEASIASIDPTMVRCHQLNATAIEAIGMYVLGDTAWAVISPSLEPRTTWSSFKNNVELLFGLLYVTLDLGVVPDAASAD